VREDYKMGRTEEWRQLCQNITWPDRNISGRQ